MKAIKYITFYLLALSFIRALPPRTNTINIGPTVSYSNAQQGTLFVPFFLLSSSVIYSSDNSYNENNIGDYDYYVDEPTTVLLQWGLHYNYFITPHIATSVLANQAMPVTLTTTGYYGFGDYHYHSKMSLFNPSLLLQYHTQPLSQSRISLYGGLGASYIQLTGHENIDQDASENIQKLAGSIYTLLASKRQNVAPMLQFGSTYTLSDSMLMDLGCSVTLLHLTNTIDKTTTRTYSYTTYDYNAGTYTPRTISYDSLSSMGYNIKNPTSCSMRFGYIF